MMMRVTSTIANINSAKPFNNGVPFLDQTAGFARSAYRREVMRRMVPFFISGREPRIIITPFNTLSMGGSRI